MRTPLTTVVFGSLLVVALPLAGCGDSSADGSSTMSTGSGGSGGSDGDGACELAADTTKTDTVAPTGCAVLDRDTSSCRAAREAAGLSGYWLSFSCRVDLSVTTNAGAEVVEAKSDGLPDYESNYFASSDPCHVDYTGAIQNPNTIASESLDVLFPMAPSGSSQAMKGAVVGMALNGVGIFGNFAAPGDDIYKESETFDACAGHPQMSGGYHYHTEPFSISYDDDRFIGVMRDGYPIYGRRDPDGTIPTVDADGGHTGVTVDSPTTPVYHYHVNLQTSSNPQSAGEQAWFLTTGTFHGTPASCTTCN